MDEYRVRAGLFGTLILLVLVILGGRLAWLQLFDREAYASEATNNAVREILVRPARGAIYDRNGNLMVDNATTFSISITPRYFGRDPRDRKAYDTTEVRLLASLLEVPDSVVWNGLAKAIARNPDAPTPVFKEVPFAAFGRVQENHFRLPGVEWGEQQTRRYVTAARAAHVLGYIREINGPELERRYDDGYRRGDMMGITGVERNYEMYLRGKLGLEFRKVNARGLDIGALNGGANDSPPLSGYNVVLTLDAKLQAFAESLFVGKRGGVVALDPQTGEILSLVSAPDYDLTTFTQSVDRDTWRYLTESKVKPMYNRATQSMQPPGSTWKPFMALMALQEGTIDTTSIIRCGGGHPIGGGARFRCMHVDGPINVRTAITRSCNTFFFELMYRSDVNTFKRYASMFGFGERVLTDVAEQTPGLMPDSSYYNDRYGTGKWAVGYWLNLGIGQGDMGTTPFELARYMGIVATNGRKPVPHLIKELRHPETGEVVRPTLPATERVPIDSSHFEAVRRGMRGVMEAGTGRSLQIPGIPSGGKTGTAQAPGVGRKDNSVFVMFAPYDNPRIAIGIQVENAGFGATAAGPIASLMAEYYLTGRITAPERKARAQFVRTVQSQPLPADIPAPVRKPGNPSQGRETLNDDGVRVPGRPAVRNTNTRR
jgi:penicillin-binding protein 2